MKCSKRQLYWHLFELIIILCSVIFKNDYFIYGLFIIIVLNGILKKRKLSDLLWEIAITSIIVPNNFVTPILSLIIFFMEMANKSLRLKKNKLNQAVFLFLLWNIISTLVNSVNPVNILFWIINSLPFYLLILHGERIKYLEQYINRIFLIELEATFFNLLFRHVGEDWSTGTFGVHQQAQLFLVCAFIFLHKLFIVIKEKKRYSYHVFACLGSFIIMLSTNCYALLFCLLAALAFAYFIRFSIKRILISAALLIGIGITLFSLSEVVVGQSDTLRMAQKIVNDKSYRLYRFHKLQGYSDVYINIPMSDARFAIMGEGSGNYSSRAALTCTGLYTSWYKHLFSVHMGEKTAKYIYPDLQVIKLNAATDFGSIIWAPYSTFISIMGETGYIGVILMILVFVRLYRRNNTFESKMMITFLILICLPENYSEFVKPMLLFALCIPPQKYIGGLKQDDK